MSNPKPRATLEVAIEEKRLTIGTLRHLVDKAANFADDAKVNITPDVVRVVQESQKPITSEELAAALYPQDTFPRDELGRFVKRR